MFCTKCGTENPAGSGQCFVCGEQFTQTQAYQPAFSQMNYQQPMQNTYNGYNTATITTPANRPNITYVQDGMKWYLFMVWGYLIFNALSMFTNCINYFKVGSIYTAYNNSEELELLGNLVIITGVLSIVEGIYSIYVRQLLIDFRSKAISHLHICIMAPIVWVIIIYVIIMSMAGIGFGDFIEMLVEQSGNPVLVIEFVAMIVMAIGNVIYFKNRTHMFVN